MSRQYATLDADGYVPLSQLRYSYRSLVLDLTPLAYWRLGERTGTTAADATGNGYDGTYANSPTLGVAGLVAGTTDTAMEGTGLSIGSGVMVTPALPALPAWSIVFLHAGSGVTATEISVNQGDYFAIRQSSNDTWQYYAGVSWVPVGVDSSAGGAAYAWRYDGTTLSLYKDGVVGYSATVAIATIPSGAWFFGANDAIGQAGITGVIDEPAIWARALSDPEIASLHEAST